MRVVCTLYSLFLGVQKREGWEKVSLCQSSRLPIPIHQRADSI